MFAVAARNCGEVVRGTDDMLTARLQPAYGHVCTGLALCMLRAATHAS
jgi:hypothetical protein